LEAPRVRQKVDRRADELSAPLDVRPAGLEHLQPLAMLGGGVEDARPFRGAHPLVSVRGEEGDVRTTDVDRQRADGLDRVYAEENVASRAELSYGVEIGGCAVVKRDRGHGDDARPLVDGALDGVDGRRVDDAAFDAAALQP